ncbi:alkylhydroperoxidase AhpD family core domain-containing protein [Flavobacterium fluvii]|uniref:Alkylhydroperoxidase AhpD family core domain-containing protein n=1 Tax=Flavobacterium fluvii TaxID=468056 RepID=A0A1M5JNH9_9FLAO|nr:carboxymuconolactone decarboxylase family protein [Flavobacterium fluvii]SHG42088.1 alkylhydroperoxidase AhpD family core domain-containing protein [Flavobacterium fluvii]
METRVNILQTQPEAYKAMMGLEKYIAATSLTPTHKELIKIRASQINGCAFCINMHTRDARKMGETEQRIYLLNAWRETTLYTEEEQAILAMTEEVTLIQNHLSKVTYDNARKLFDEKYIAEIIMMITTINAWNRIAIATEMPID